MCYDDALPREKEEKNNSSPVDGKKIFTILVKFFLTIKSLDG